MNRETKPCLQFSSRQCTFAQSIPVMEKLRGLQYYVRDHPPYSPGLIPSDFHLFWKLKIFLAGHRFSANQETMLL